MSWCMMPSCNEGMERDEKGIERCPECGWSDDNTHWAGWSKNVESRTQNPVLNYVPPTDDPRPVSPIEPGPCDPGPVTEVERVVEIGLRAYDTAREPVQAARDLSLKLLFKGLRALFYKEKK